MKNTLAARLSAAGVSGILLAAYIHNDYVNWGTRGRDAFIAHQLQRFDRYMAIPQPMMNTMVSSVIFAVGALAIYEGLVYVFSALFRGSRASSQAS